MEGAHIEQHNGVDPRFVAAREAFDALMHTDDGVEKMIALQSFIAAHFPNDTEAKQQAAKYALFHAIIASGTPEFTPELIKAFDTPSGDFAKLVAEYTGLRV